MNSPTHSHSSRRRSTASNYQLEEGLGSPADLAPGGYEGYEGHAPPGEGGGGGRVSDHQRATQRWQVAGHAAARAGGFVPQLRGGMQSGEAQQLREARNEAARLQSQLDTAREREREMKDMQSLKEQALREAANKVHTNQVKLQEVEASLVSWQTRAQVSEATAEENDRRAGEERARLQAQLDELSKRSSDVAAELARVEAKSEQELEYERREGEKVRDQLSVTAAELLKVTSGVSDMKSYVEKKVSALSSEKEAQEAEVRAQQETARLLEGEINSKQGEIQEQHRKHELANQQWDMRHRHLEAHVARLNADLETANQEGKRRSQALNEQLDAATGALGEMRSEASQSRMKLERELELAEDHRQQIERKAHRMEEAWVAERSVLEAELREVRERERSRVAELEDEVEQARKEVAAKSHSHRKTSEISIASYQETLTAAKVQSTLLADRLVAVEEAAAQTQEGLDKKLEEAKVDSDKTKLRAQEVQEALARAEGRLEEARAEVLRMTAEAQEGALAMEREKREVHARKEAEERERVAQQEGRGALEEAAVLQALNKSLNKETSTLQAQLEEARTQSLEAVKELAKLRQVEVEAEVLRAHLQAAQGAREEEAQASQSHKAREAVVSSELSSAREEVRALRLEAELQRAEGQATSRLDKEKLDHAIKAVSELEQAAERREAMLSEERARAAGLLREVAEERVGRAEERGRWERSRDEVLLLQAERARADEREEDFRVQNSQDIDQARAETLRCESEVVRLREVEQGLKEEVSMCLSQAALREDQDRCVREEWTKYLQESRLAAHAAAQSISTLRSEVAARDEVIRRGRNLLRHRQEELEDLQVAFHEFGT